MSALCSWPFHNLDHFEMAKLSIDLFQNLTWFQNGLVISTLIDQSYLSFDRQQFFDLKGFHMHRNYLPLTFTSKSNPHGQNGFLPDPVLVISW